MIGATISIVSNIASQLIGFTSIDPNTATFDKADVIPEYKDGGSRQWGAKVANNTGYNWRHSDQNLFIENDEYTAPASNKTYDADRNYIGKYMKLEVGLSATIFTMPVGINSAGDVLTTEWIQLTTTFQTVPFTQSIQIRAENSGGFTLRVTSGQTSYLLGSITELRQIIGIN